MKNFMLHTVVKSSLVRRNIKDDIFKALIRSIVVYWYETWTLAIRSVETPAVHVSSVLRKLCSSIREMMAEK